MPHWRNNRRIFVAAPRQRAGFFAKARRLALFCAAAGQIGLSSADAQESRPQDGGLIKARVDYCLAFRDAGHECRRTSIAANWTCDQEPKLDIRGKECISWDPETEQTCRARFGPGAYRFRPSTSADLAVPPEPPGSLACFKTSFPQHSETVLPLAPAFARADRFTLPKQKFPQCIAVRIQTHECSRPTEAHAWTCDARPPLGAPTALCLVETFGQPPPGAWRDAETDSCRFADGYKMYVTKNFDPLTYDVEPQLKCESAGIGVQIARGYHPDVGYAIGYTGGFSLKAPYVMGKSGFNE